MKRSAVRAFPALLLGLCALVFSACLSVAAPGAAGDSSLALDGLVQPPSPDAEASLAAETADWYKDANFYHLWVASFSDSDGNGIGDIDGITEKLDYLADLGVTALWLSPFFKNASGVSNLHGYDATDYSLVDPRLGTNEDLRELLVEAHGRGMRVIFDFVPNHVSNKHPWFLDSKAGRDGKRDWFIWRNKKPEEGWAGWNGSSVFRSGGNDPSGKPQWYYAIFWDGMPDLNYRNPEVREAMASVVKSWLDFGFDGMRVDAVRYLAESRDGMVNGVSEIAPETYEFFQELRSELLDPYGDMGYHKFMVAENWGADNGSFEGFMVKDGKRAFQMSLDFTFGNRAYETLKGGAAGFRYLQSWQAGAVTALQSKDAWTGTFLNNHDNYQSRPASAFSGDGRKIALAAALQYTGLGTPFWYYGNELGMEGVNRGDDKQFRTKMDWSRLDEALAEPDSVFHAVRDLMRLRSSRASLRRGAYISLETGEGGAVAFLRELEGERSLVALNPTDGPAELSVAVDAAAARALLGGKGSKLEGGRLLMGAMPAYGYAVWALE